jgi:hypothetical protein
VTPRFGHADANTANTFAVVAFPAGGREAGCVGSRALDGSMRFTTTPRS